MTDLPDMEPLGPLDELGLCDACVAGIYLARATGADSFTLCPACVQIIDPGHDCSEHHHHRPSRAERRAARRRGNR